MDLTPAADYRRVSTEDQSDSGYSLPKQWEANSAYARTHNLDLAADFVEDISGTVPIEERPQGRALLEWLRLHPGAALIVHEADRLSRDIVNLLATVQRLLRAGVAVHIADVGQVESELDIGLVIRAWQGGSEHRRITDRLMRGKRGKAEAGHWVGGTPPYGYRSQGARRAARMVVYEPEAEIVRAIFRWYTAERLSMLAIADRLNAGGVPTQRGATWWKAILKKILSNETYIGVVYYAGIRIDLPELAIVDAATFERAQQLRQSNRARAARNRQREYLLANHLRCGCGETMTGSTTPNTYQRTYYRCSQFQWPKTARTCSAPFASGHVVEHLVWSHLFEMITDEELLQAGVAAVNAAAPALDPAAEVDRLERAIAAANRRIERLLREFGADDDEEIVKATRAAVREAQREREEAKARRAQLLDAQREQERERAGQDAVLEQIRTWRATIGQADFAFKRDVLEALDVRVAVLRDADGQRVVQVSTRVSPARSFVYLNARRYQQRVWDESGESPW